MQEKRLLGTFALVATLLIPACDEAGGDPTPLAPEVDPLESALASPPAHGGVIVVPQLPMMSAQSAQDICEGGLFAGGTVQLNPHAVIPIAGEIGKTGGLTVAGYHTGGATTIVGGTAVTNVGTDSAGCEYNRVNHSWAWQGTRKSDPSQTCGGSLSHGTSFSASSHAPDCNVTQLSLSWTMPRIYQAIDAVISNFPIQSGKPWYEATSATISSDVAGGQSVSYSWSITQKTNRTGSGDIVSNCASSTSANCAVTFDSNDAGTFFIELTVSDSKTSSTVSDSVVVYNTNPPSPSIFGPDSINYNGQTCTYFGSASGGVPPYSGGWGGVVTGTGFEVSVTGGPNINPVLHDLWFGVTDDFGKTVEVSKDIAHDYSNSQPMCPT